MGEGGTDIGIETGGGTYMQTQILDKVPIIQTGYLPVALINNISGNLFQISTSMVRYFFISEQSER